MPDDALKRLIFKKKLNGQWGLLLEYAYMSGMNDHKLLGGMLTKEDIDKMFREFLVRLDADLRNED